MARLKPKKHKNHKIVPEGKRLCPICEHIMDVETKYSISVDICPEHGIWLDKGELGKIKSRLKRRDGMLRQAQQRDHHYDCDCEGQSILNALFSIIDNH